MSKYNKLWEYIQKEECFSLSFDEIENILEFPLDHSFLSYKKECIDFGYEVQKISMKEKKVSFSKIQIRKLKKGDEKLLIHTTKQFRKEVISKEKATSILENKDIWVYVAYSQKNIMGYILAYVLKRIDTGNDMLMIYHCFVLDRYQGHHIGQQLMKKILEDAKDMHYTFLITQENNKAANALYTKCKGQLHEQNKNVYYWYQNAKPKL